MSMTSSDGQNENTRYKAFRDARDALMSKTYVTMLEEQF
jgi:hypothetical protein